MVAGGFDYLLKTRMASDALSAINFWGWQLIIVSAAVTLPLGITTGKEYAELEWFIDIAITLLWVVFGINMMGTIIKRREKHLYVAIWFYIATFVTASIQFAIAVCAGATFAKTIITFGIYDAFFI